MKEIGSIFPFPKGCRGFEVDTSKYRDEMIYTSLCREALYLIAEKELVNGRTVLLPKYTCDTVKAPFRELRYNAALYPIDKDLTINIKETTRLFAEKKPNLMVIHPYFGMDLTMEEQNMLKEFSTQGCTIILDLTQCLFSKIRLPFIKYYVGSYRKWFPIPDGAFLEGDVKDLCLVENKEIVALQTKAMRLRGQYFESGDSGLKQESIRLSHEVEELMASPITPHIMASISKQLLVAEDREREQKIRLENYQRLYNGLHDAEDIEIIADISRVTTAPLFFPFRVKDVSTLQRKLAEQSIYARLIWEPEDRILTIAIDSRYDLSDMDRVIATVKK